KPHRKSIPLLQILALRIGAISKTKWYRQTTVIFAPESVIEVCVGDWGQRLLLYLVSGNVDCDATLGVIDIVDGIPVINHDIRPLPLLQRTDIVKLQSAGCRSSG